ncbi:PIN domain-containing protein [Leptolyngbya sp. 15MV]|nr:PIN domain-containing protein [Leptolyngbya sp. 15MV]
MILLDTNVVSELLRDPPHSAVTAWASAVPRSEMVTTSITEAELRLGVAMLPRSDRRERLQVALDSIFRRWLGSVVLPFDSLAARHFAVFRARRRREGRSVAPNDAMIAAIAIAHGVAAIATRNTPDFEGCGVPLINPWDA